MAGMISGLSSFSVSMFGSPRIARARPHNISAYFDYFWANRKRIRTLWRRELDLNFKDPSVEEKRDRPLEVALVSRRDLTSSGNLRRLPMSSRSW